MTTTHHLILAAAESSHPMRAVGYVGAQITIVGLATWAIIRGVLRVRRNPPVRHGYPPAAPPVWHPQYGWITPHTLALRQLLRHTTDPACPRGLGRQRTHTNTSNTPVPA
jgi:hypothetical protein